MSISKLPYQPTSITPQEGEVFFKFDNGDWQAIKNAVEQYNFINEQAMFRFALFILLEAENNNVFIEQDGVKKRVNPNPTSLNSQQAPAPLTPTTPEV